MDKGLTMPVTKYKSKVTRTPQPKQCTGCYKKCQELLDMAVENEKLTVDRDDARKFADYYYDLLTQERRQWADFLENIQLIQSGCTRELGGSVWIRGEQLAECLSRYTNARGK